MKKNFLTISLLCLFCSANIYAAAKFAGTYKAIDRVLIGGNGDLFVYPDLASGEKVFNPYMMCSETDRYVVRKDHPAFERLYSLILLSYAQGWRINPQIKSDRCALDSPEIESIFSDQ